MRPLFLFWTTVSHATRPQERHALFALPRESFGCQHWQHFRALVNRFPVGDKTYHPPEGTHKPTSVKETQEVYGNRKLVLLSRVRVTSLIFSTKPASTIWRPSLTDDRIEYTDLGLARNRS